MDKCIPTGVKYFIRETMEKRSKKLRGIIFFRMPKEKDNIVLSLDEYYNVLMDKKNELKYSIQVKRIKNTRNILTFRVILRNRNSSESELDHNDQYIQIQLKGARIISAEQGDFDDLLFGTYSTDNLQECSMKRADTIRLKEFFLDKGEKVQSGEI